MHVWKYLVLTRWRTQQNVFLFNSGDRSWSCHADWGCDWWAYVAQHSFSFFTTYQQTVEDFFFFFKEKIILFLNLLILIKCSVLKNNEDVSYDLNLQPIESEIKGL